MSGVAQEQAGLASGVVNTSFMMGGAVGLAVLASLADRRTDELLAAGEGQLAGLNGGYQLAFIVGAVFLVASAVVGAALLRTGASEHARARRRAGPAPSRPRTPRGRAASRSATHPRHLTRIAFIGAGSTVFTRNLVADVLRMPELRESTTFASWTSTSSG